MFVIIDIETTGNNCKYSNITELAVYQHNGQKITNLYTTLINPGIDIPYYITTLTGIDNEMVKNAPKFHEVAKIIIELTAGRTFVAHNVKFDYGFIREEFSRLGYDFNLTTLCTVQLARKLLPGHSSYSLGKLCSDLGIEINGRHRAPGDALATVKLFELLLQKNALIENSKNGNFKLF
ncbi:MAG TPA: 3'-5' exonuclease [Draconibacterium sp.]|nr:3'-5' exonuclease [Draconibacterium sp.]